ncbi:MAG TPA: hypothetical protein EYP35_06700 [Desulfobacterales bacterium]|nr:hypothetical protein [Desulfobacterales bacterium]HIP38432.1 hypothetical protein [Desulfocapsa sulfexigens]
MNNRKIVSPVFVLLLAAVFAFLPVQISLCQAATIVTGSPPADGNTEKKSEVKTSRATVTDSEESSEKDAKGGLSKGMMIGVGAGAAVLIGVAIAAGGGGGGEDTGVSVPGTTPIDASSSSAAPPTPAQLVAAWHAEGNQPGSGRTYTGTYHLFDGGSIGYDLYVSSGEHLVGGGSWRVSDYQLQIHTDHGSLYSGNFAPGNYSYINMNANTQWNLTLSR